MRKNSRAYKIYEAGLAEAEALIKEDPELGPVDHPEIKVLAAMLDFATKPKSTPKKPPLLFDEKKVLSALEMAGIKLEVARHGRLNRNLRNCDLRPTDLELMVGWITTSMHPWLQSKDIELTYSMLCRKWPEWLERARTSKQGTPVNQTEAWVV